MKNIFTSFKTFFLIFLLVNVNLLLAQDNIVISCAGMNSEGNMQTVCGVNDIEGTYTDSGNIDSESGQIIYEGPVGNIAYQIKCVASIVPGAGLTVYRWEIFAVGGAEFIYQNNDIQLTPYAFSDDKNWASRNSTFDAPPIGVNFLPVELTRFKATVKGENVNLHWQTTTELNNEGFEVQRSSDNRNWEILDFIVGQGTTYDVQDYEFVDEKPLNGINYYRLKQMDYDGRFAFSAVISQKITNGTLEIYPNPVNGQSVSLKFSITNYTDAQVKIYDNLGKLMQQSLLSNGETNLNINDLPNGLYIVSVQMGGHLLQERLVKK